MMTSKRFFVFLMIPMVFFADLASTQGQFINHYDSQVVEYHTNHGIVAHVQAIVKGTALLPCDLTPPTPNDSIVLIVWYKGKHTPIYSYDTRTSNNNAHRWQDVSLENRAFFRTMTEPSTLSIENIAENEEGEYRCRIDFMKSPTKNLKVILAVIVPPQKPKIIDEKGKEIETVAGPYEEGGDMKLTCIVTGGKPEPTIKWWRGEKLIDSTETHSGFQNVRSNQLVIKGLQRSDQHAAFTCQASNNNISQPVSATVSIEIYFRPLKVEILSSNQPFSADRMYEIPCQTFGSRPTAKISWWMDGVELKSDKFNYTQTDSADGNTSTSTLMFIPTRLDNDRMLTCRAVNPLVQGGLEENSIKLNVFYIPILHLSLGSNLNPDDIEEGDDVYFECKVNANPWAYKVLWKHNGQVMQQNQKAGIIMSNSDLALQGVSRNQAGNYTCVASNVEGDGDSNVVELKIMYKPICRSDHKRVYGVARHENAKILCEVESYPLPDSFKWSFNNTAETIEVPQTRYNSDVHHSSSTLSYTPVSELDYGTVMCWASNLAGRQLEPCVFHIIAAGKPDPPYNCSILNQTSDSLEVECVEGFDGGLTQYFQLEVYDEQNDILQINVSAKFPLFTVSGLEPGKMLKMMVYAANAKGHSEGITLEGFTLKVAEKQTVLSLGTRDQMEIAPILGILIGIVSALLCVTVIILAALKLRATRRDGSHAIRPGFLPVKEKATLPLRTETEDLYEMDDKNPDVVPANKDSDYQLGSEVQTPGPNNSVAVNNEFEGQRIITPLSEAYVTRDRQYQPQHVTNEVTYAELSLARPNTLDTTKNVGNQFPTQKLRDESIIYAQIDHTKNHQPVSTLSAKPSPILSPVSSLFPVKPSMYHREVVTIRTPLMGCQQESCV
ncbi:PREDICTED: synaptogenesis protein syg-2 isoform X2 [Nicrophorus vespilloides]|uniref:Synaptogenesis protein syg-2 isoform X2 n=1 Tax=Nicrophorus vespilloides TaxID=110193 RepID=A0ABM1NKH1_NICVS|nr:PREDICTED: synaptogenesis protein syg-2 isoform X2 [Nicrophorus vespilloides]